MFLCVQLSCTLANLYILQRVPPRETHQTKRRVHSSADHYHHFSDTVYLGRCTVEDRVRVVPTWDGISNVVGKFRPSILERSKISLLLSKSAQVTEVVPGSLSSAVSTLEKSRKVVVWRVENVSEDTDERKYPYTLLVESQMNCLI